MATKTLPIPTWEAFDPTSREYWEDPVAYYQGAHREHPVFNWAPSGTLCVIRYDDVVHVLQDFETWSSLAMGAQAHPLPAELRARVSEEGERIVGTIMRNQLAASDPPLHTRQRRLAQAVFTRSRITATHARIAEIVDELIDELAGAGSCDLMQQFAYRLSLRVAGTMLGLPAGDLPRFREWITE